jgi:hypothetical protein
VKESLLGYGLHSPEIASGFLPLDSRTKSTMRCNAAINHFILFISTLSLLFYRFACY